MIINLNGIQNQLKEVSTLLKNSQYKRVILVFSGMCAILFITAAIELAFSYAGNIKFAKLDADNLSQVFQTQIEGTFKKIDLVLVDTAKSLEQKENLSEWKQEELDAFMSERKSQIPEINSIFVVGKDGYDRTRTKSGKHFYLADRDYFYKQITSTKNELIFSKPIVSRESGRLIVVLSRKLVNAKNEFQGIVAAGIPLTFFSEFYSKLNLRPNSAITINSSENLLYSRYPWAEKFIGMPLYNHDAIRELFYNGKNVFLSEKKSKIDGVTRVLSSRKVQGYNFFVVVALSKYEYLKGWFIKSVLYFIVLTTLSLFGANFLIQSLRSLNDLEDQRKLSIQNAKMTSLGEMAGGIAHEINNPLAVVSGRCNQLLKMLEKNDYDRDAFKASLEKINQTTDRIAKIIKSLKAFSRNNEQDPFTPVSLREIAEHTVEICKEKFRHSAVALKVDPIPDLKINCRESQVVQVMLNLLSNAFDAVESFEEKWVKLSVEKKDKLIMIKVTDSGTGISETVAANIMQPFFTTKEVGKGTGLGLSISKGIIEDHKGVIYLDKKSPNTCFVIEMPVA